MGDFSLFRAAVISKAIYGDNEEPGFSTVQADFPATEEAGAAYGKTLAEIQDAVDGNGDPWWKGKAESFDLGRIRDPEDPYFRSKVWVKAGANDLFVGRVLQHGVDGSSDYARPGRDTVPAACIVVITVTAASVLLAIDQAATHFVLGVHGPDINGDPLPAGLLPYEFDTPIPSARWTDPDPPPGPPQTLREGMIVLGLSEAKLDEWKTENPDATPRDFAKKFKTLIN